MENIFHVFIANKLKYVRFNRKVKYFHKNSQILEVRFNINISNNKITKDKNSLIFNFMKNLKFTVVATLRKQTGQIQYGIFDRRRKIEYFGK